MSAQIHVTGYEKRDHIAHFLNFHFITPKV